MSQVGKRTKVLLIGEGCLILFLIGCVLLLLVWIWRGSNLAVQTPTQAAVEGVGQSPVPSPQARVTRQFVADDLSRLVLQQSEVPAGAYLIQDSFFGDAADERSARATLLQAEPRLSDLGMTASYWRVWSFGERYSGNGIGSGAWLFKNNNDATNALRLITSLQEQNTSGRFKLNYSRVEGLGDEAYVAVRVTEFFYWWRTGNVILSFSYSQTVGSEYYQKAGRVNWVSESKARELVDIMQSHAQ